MRTGAVRPLVCCTTGPSGTRDRSGGGPRSSGTSRSSNRPSGSQRRGVPDTAFTRQSPRGRARASPTDTTQGRRPSSVSIRKASHPPSGDQRGDSTEASSGSTTGVRRPLSTSSSSRAMERLGLWGPWVVGSKRVPARASMGAARSASSGMARPWASSRCRPVGSRSTDGGGGASSTCTITSGGVRQPASASCQAVGDSSTSNHSAHVVMPGSSGGPGGGRGWRRRPVGGAPG